MVFEHLEAVSIDFEAIVTKKSVQALDEIRNIMHNEQLNDFEVVDEAVQPTP